MSSIGDPTSDEPDDADIIQQDLERDSLYDQGLLLRPRLFGQKTDEHILPTHSHFECIYEHIYEPEIYDYVQELEKWVHFNLKYKLYKDESQPILNLQGIEQPNAYFGLSDLSVINSELIAKKQKQEKKRRKLQEQQLQPGHGKLQRHLEDKAHSQKTPASQKDTIRDDPHSSGCSSDSFFIISKPSLLDTNNASQNESEHSNSQSNSKASSHASSPDHQSTNSPIVNPIQPNFGLNDLDLDLDSDSDSDMERKEKVPAFFPPDRFDGRNKNLTKQHWQVFKDFRDQHNLVFEDIPAAGDREAIRVDNDKICGYFKITLSDLARSWFDRNTFESPHDLEKKFLNDFSPYGKSPHQWLQQWNTLQFNPETDNIDEFLVKFDDLATLVGAPDDFKLMAFKILMPRDVVIAMHNLNNFDECAQTGHDLMTIIQNPVTNKMSALSLLQSHSPSPQPHPQSPSPGPSALPNDTRQSRSRERAPPTFRRTQQNPQRSRSILNRKFLQKHASHFAHFHKVPLQEKHNIKLPTGQVIYTDGLLALPILINGHLFQFLVLVTSFSDDLELIFGMESLIQLESSLFLMDNTLSVTPHCIPLYPTHEIVLQPQEQKPIYLYGNLPNSFSSGDEITHVPPVDPTFSVLTLEAEFVNQSTCFLLSNRSTENRIFPSTQPFAYFDTRSVGHYKPFKAIELLKNHPLVFPSSCAALISDTSNISCHSNSFQETQDSYPWFDLDDPQRFKADRQILEKLIDLSQSCLSPEKRKKFYDLLVEYADVFSLRDEIGLAPNMQVELEVLDKKPFFIHPFSVKENMKPKIDKEMRKLEILDILKKGLSRYSSPAMPIPHKNSDIPRIVADFRHLNTKLLQLHMSFPLVKECIQQIGASQCEVMSVIDL